MKKLLKVVSNVLVIFVVVLVFLLHGTRLLGIEPYTVLSGSMESVYPTGSIIYVKAVDEEKLQENDVITFKMSNGTIATHRIIELVQDENNPHTVLFRTKGDENKIADGTLVNKSDVIGSPIFCIPLLGFFATYIAYPPGKYVAVSVAVSFILIEIIIGILLDDKKAKSK